MDSLRKLADTQTGIQKVNALNTRSGRLIFLDFNLAIEAIEKSLTLSDEISYVAGLAEATVNKAIIEKY